MRRFLDFLFGHRSSPDSAHPSVLAGLPFELLEVPGTQAPALRERLLARDDCTPVILGSEADVAPFVARLGGRPADVPAILHEADNLDLDRWLHERRAADPHLFNVPVTGWPELAPRPPDGLEVPLEVLSRAPKQRVLIGLVPTVRAWEVPAHVRFGGWNNCPPPEVHVALHRRWSLRWGAQVACMASDVIECTVAWPPTERDEALQLAREHLVYCPDIVHQAAQSLEELAAGLLGAKSWYFWWE